MELYPNQSECLQEVSHSSGLNNCPAGPGVCRCGPTVCKALGTFNQEEGNVLALQSGDRALPAGRKKGRRGLEGSMCGRWREPSVAG